MTTQGSRPRKRQFGSDEEITHKLDLFKTPPSSSQVERGRWTTHNASGLNDNSTELFITVPSVETEFTDLSDAKLEIEYKSCGANGADVGAQDAFEFYMGDHGDLLISKFKNQWN